MQISFLGKSYRVEPVAMRYTDGNLAIQVLSDSGVFGMLSTNVDGVQLAPNEFCVKTWSENDPWALEIVSQCPQFEDTGRTFRSGFVSGPIYRMVG